MNYKELKIPASLSDIVQSIWALEEEARSTQPKAFRTIADGKPGLIFQHSDNGIFYQGDKKLPAVFLYGASTKHSKIELSGQFKTVGVFFKPSALKIVFGLDANELTDTCLDLNLISTAKNFQLSEVLQNSGSRNDQVDVLSAFLISQIRKNEKYVDAKVKHALSEINLSNGTLSLKELTTHLNLTERSLERKFKEFIGLSPKLYSRISRFQQTLQQLQNGSYGRLTDVAFDNCFADQSHFIRTFKEFSGFTPRDYLLQANVVA